jgi:hypothetical protein
MCGVGTANAATPVSGVPDSHHHPRYLGNESFGEQGSRYGQAAIPVGDAYGCPRVAPREALEAAWVYACDERLKLEPWLTGDWAVCASLNALGELGAADACAMPAMNHDQRSISEAAFCHIPSMCDS